MKSSDGLCKLIEEVGFVPFFKNEIEGFSIEECCPERLWFTDDDGPWEWKGPTIQKAKCAYGKFLKNKAMYVSKDFFPDFANVRRDGYGYDARVDEGIARNRDKIVMSAVEKHAPVLSKDLKDLSYGDKKNRGYFDATVTFLQMQTYLNIADFRYMTDKSGKPYGWGVAVFTTPELFFGDAFTKTVYRKEPSECEAFLTTHLKKILPHATDSQIQNIIYRK